MIFQHTWQWVLNGTKTQTRRLVKPGQFDFSEDGYPVGVYSGNINDMDSAKPVYICGKTYSVQPGRGKPSVWWREFDGQIQHTLDGVIYNPSFNAYHSEVDHDQLIRVDRRNDLSEMGYQSLRIRIVSIHNEDVRYISNPDVWAEGYTYVARFGLPLSFWDTWVGMHDKSYLETFRKATADYSHMTIYHLVKAGFFTKPIERYNAWVLTFEVVKDS